MPASPLADKENVMVTMQSAIAVISDLVADVEAVGAAQVKEEWFDIYCTYLLAKQFLEDAGH